MLNLLQLFILCMSFRLEDGDRVEGLGFEYKIKFYTQGLTKQ